MKTFSTILVGIVSICILFYLANYSVSLRVVPSLQEFIASSTEAGVNVKEDQDVITNQQIVIGKESSSTHFGIFRSHSTVFRITTAKTPADREMGLSGRMKLDPDEGLLFIFPKPGIYPFWMKDMNFPIDIVWIDSARKIVSISENISPKTYPNSFVPPKNVQFVLEINANASKNSGLREGDIVSFENI